MERILERDTNDDDDDGNEDDEMTLLNRDTGTRDTDTTRRRAENI